MTKQTDYIGYKVTTSRKRLEIAYKKNSDIEFIADYIYNTHRLGSMYYNLYFDYWTNAKKLILYNCLATERVIKDVLRWCGIDPDIVVGKDIDVVFCCHMND